MGGVTIPTNRRRGANSSPVPSCIKFDPAFICACFFGSERHRDLTCRLRKSPNPSLSGGFQWEE